MLMQIIRNSSLGCSGTDIAVARIGCVADRCGEPSLVTGRTRTVPFRSATFHAGCTKSGTPKFLPAPSLRI